MNFLKNFILLLLLLQSIQLCVTDMPTWFDYFRERISLKVEVSQKISATLTEKDTGQSFKITQIVDAKNDWSTINIQTADEGFQIFYRFNKDQRYLIRGNECILLEWPTFDESKKPIISQSVLTDFVLALGPHRVSEPKIFIGEFSPHLDSELDDPRGFKSFVREKFHDNMLAAWSYSEVPMFDSPDSRSKPFRISFYEKNSKKKLILEIYDWVEPYEVQELAMKPGIGCLGMETILEIKNFPSSAHRFTLVSADSSEEEESKSKVYVHQRYGFTQTESLDRGSAIIFDHRLGIEYQFRTKNKKTLCEVKTLSKKDYRILNMINKFGQNEEAVFPLGKMHYLGQELREDLPNKLYNVWESVVLDESYENKKYSKIVGTVYSIKKSQETGLGEQEFDIPVILKINGYSKDKEEGNYIQKLRKEFRIFDFSGWKFSSVLPGPYHIKDCFNELDDDRQEVRILMKSTIDSTKEIDYQKFDEMIRSVLFKKIFSSISISALRISSISLKFSQDLIVAHVTFLRRPSLEKSYLTKRIKIDLNKYPDREIYSDPGSCFKSARESMKRKFISCPSERVCIMLSENQKVSEIQSGEIECILHSSQEASLEKSINETELNFVAEDLSESFKNKPRVSMVSTGLPNLSVRAVLIDDTGNFRNGILGITPNQHFVPNGQEIIGIEGVKNYAECANACHRGGLSDCTAFSFCPREEQEYSSCILSSVGSPEKFLQRVNSVCFVVQLQPKSSWIKVAEGNFAPESYMKVFPASTEACSKVCFSYDYCKGFAVCSSAPSERGCFLLNETQPSLTKTDDEYCEIYRAKNPQAFTRTGFELTQGVIASYSNIIYDECADLCLNSKDVQCLSFNYCDDLTCQLSNEIIGNQSKPYTKPGKNCYNYQLSSELIRDPVMDPSIESISAFAKIAIFGIVASILIVGILLGFTVSHVFLRRRRERILSPTFVSFKQELDDDDL